MRGANNEIVGTAFVRFNRKEDALKAAERRNILRIKDITLECSKYVPKDSPQKSVHSVESANFKNFPHGYTEAQARSILEQYGVISSLYLNTADGSGNVTYSTPGAVSKVIQGLNGCKLESNSEPQSEISPFLITSNSERKTTKAYNNLYVGNVDPNVTEDEIREEFSKHGEIESLLRPTREITVESGEKKTLNKGFIYISFIDSKVASTVIKEMDGRTYWGRELDINYYDSERKKGYKAKAKTSTHNYDEMASSFMNALATFASSMGSMNRGRGGYGGYGGSNQGYRGNNYGRGGRGGRGTHRGRGSRGMRGGPPGGHYQVRAQYEKPIMGAHIQPMMGMPPPGPPPVGFPPVGPPPVGVPNAGMAQSMGTQGGGGFGMEPAPQVNIPPPQIHQPMQPMVSPPAQEVSSVQSPEGEKLVEGHSLEQLIKMENSEKENLIGTYLYNKLDPL